MRTEEKIISISDSEWIPIRKLAFLILKSAFNKNADEIRIELGPNESKVDIFANGNRKNIMNLHQEVHAQIIGMFKVMTGWLTTIPYNQQKTYGTFLIEEEDLQAYLKIEFSEDRVNSKIIGNLKILEKGNLDQLCF